MHQDLIVIDGLQYSNWDRNIFLQLKEGGVTMVHATIVYCVLVNGILILSVTLT